MLGAVGREARARLTGRGGDAPTRVYRGRTVEELIPKIERELGPDAIVVRRREGLTGGVLGFFQHPWVELEAVRGTPGLDVYDEPEDAHPPDPLGPPPAGEAPDGSPPAPTTIAALGAAQAATPAPVTPAPVTPAPVAASPYGAVASRGAAAAPAPTPPGPVGGPPGEELFDQPGGSAYVTAHLAALARATPPELQAAAVAAPSRPPAGGPPQTFAIPSLPAPRARAAPPGRVAHPAPPPSVAPAAPEPPRPSLGDLIPEQAGRPAAPIAPPPADWPARAALERRTVQPGSQTRARAGVERGLARYGIGEALAGELIDTAMAHVLPLAPRAGLAAAVRTTLAQRIPVAPPLAADGASIVLVGAGGAGKTTCCAAMLSAYRSGSTLPAAFATLLRELSGAGTPEWRLLMSPQLLKPAPLSSARALRALRRARAGGLAVLDTPRISPVDRGEIRSLGRLLAQLEPDRVLLALPATLGRAAAAQLLGALGPLKADALVVTHADETDQIGVAVEAACRFGLAPEYMLAHARGGGWQLRRLEPAALAAMVLP
jgi:hypothetical protein